MQVEPRRKTLGADSHSIPCYVATELAGISMRITLCIASWFHCKAHIRGYVYVWFTLIRGLYIPITGYSPLGGACRCRRYSGAWDPPGWHPHPALLTVPVSFPRTAVPSLYFVCAYRLTRLHYHIFTNFRKIGNCGILLPPEKKNNLHLCHDHRI